MLTAGTAAWGLNAAPIQGAAVEVGSNIVHPNGNVYDQVLLTGPSATVEADRQQQQVTRVSFIDLNDDIVQVEFSGKGSLTVSLENASGPAPAAKYNQPGVLYMRGHATLMINSPDATTNINCFSVGPATAVNPTLFPAGTIYDGVADIGLIQINGDPANPGGYSTFGGIRTGNAQFFNFNGRTGIYADHVLVQGPVIVGDLAAYDQATPYLLFDPGSQFATLNVAGGDMLQPNGRPIQMNGFHRLNFSAGTRSDGAPMPVQKNRGRFVRDGVDVTDELMPPTQS